MTKRKQPNAKSAIRAEVGKEWAKRKYLKVNPSSLISIWEIVSTWLSEATHSRYTPGELVDRFFDIACPVDGSALAPFTIFDRIGRPRPEEDWSFEYYASDEKADIAPLFFLFREEIRQWSQSPDGLLWSAKLGLQRRPAFLFGLIDENSHHNLTTKERRVGGRARKYNTGFQKLVNIAVEDIGSEKLNLTEGQLKYWVGQNCGKEEFETGIPDCNHVRIKDDEISWKDKRGTSHKLSTRSTQPYIDRTKLKSAKNGD
jgi:hypothetical protein